MGKWREAEGMYASAAEAYENPAALLGFYYRAVNVRKQASFEPEWKRTLAHVFPSGLQPAPEGDAHPAIGVVVTQDSELSRKARLLANARCLLVPSLVAETSSLVAMEAMASGTPVVAFLSGALPEVRPIWK